MTQSLRGEQLAILDAASEASSNDASFMELLLAFELPTDYLEPLISVLQQRRWTRAPRPFDYVKRAVLRRVLSGDQQPRREATASSLSKADTEIYERGGRDDWEGYEEEIIDRVPKHLRATWSFDRQGKPHVAFTPGNTQQKNKTGFDMWDSINFGKMYNVVDHEGVNWGRVVEEARLDEWEQKALAYKLEGYSCYAALREMNDQEDKKALRAAWMRLERSKLAKIKKVLI